MKNRGRRSATGRTIDGMPVLRERKTWARPKAARAFDLTPVEQSHVKRALRVIRDQYGSWKALAAVMGCHRNTLKRAARAGSTNGKRPSAGMALAAARAAGVPLEDLLSGDLADRAAKQGGPVSGFSAGRAPLALPTTP